MTDERNEPEVNRGELIYQMARIQKQIDDLEKVISLPRAKHIGVPALKKLKLIRIELREIMRGIHKAMKPEPLTETVGMDYAKALRVNR
jgi:hypothetical protein